ncbi:arylamine N-acetyltransferase [Nonomuraea ferruginea]
MWHIDDLDLDAYLDRIGHGGPRTPSAATLRAVHRAHVTAIPFENLDVVLGRGIPLDPKSLQDKMVTGGRGGYCHEHNLLFAAALERLGFPVTRLLARIRLGGRSHLPRSHAMLLVTADGRRWLADVGFGGDGLVEPMPFAEEATASAGPWRWRLTRDGDLWILHAGEEQLYGFRTDEPHYPSDFEVANHYVATHPPAPRSSPTCWPSARRSASAYGSSTWGARTAEGLRDGLRDRIGITISEADAASLLPLIYPEGRPD